MNIRGKYEPTPRPCIRADGNEVLWCGPRLPSWITIKPCRRVGTPAKLETPGPLGFLARHRQPIDPHDLETNLDPRQTYGVDVRSVGTSDTGQCEFFLAPSAFGDEPFDLTIVMVQ